MINGSIKSDMKCTAFVNATIHSGSDSTGLVDVYYSLQHIQHAPIKSPFTGNTTGKPRDEMKLSNVNVCVVYILLVCIHAWEGSQD